MSKLLALLKSKKFWTLVTAIVAALSAFFLTSCVSAGSVLRRGVHHDTVEYQFKIRSRNFQTFAQCQTELLTNFQLHSIPTFGQFIPASGTSTVTAITMNSPVIAFAGFSFSRRNLTPTFREFMNLSGITRLISVPVSQKSCSTVPNGLMVASLFPVTSPTFGEKCLIAFVPIAFLRRSRRRGGRKGRPKGTKTIPLGGSHF
jgi:flagellar biosynthesis protein FlhB